jgi:hypothetical protein
MKKVLSIMAVVAVALTFGVAYADQMPLDREIEASAYLGVISLKLDAGFKGVAAGGVREEDHGYSIIDDLSPAGVVRDTGGLGKTQIDEVKGEKMGAKGVAAGGMRSEEYGFSFIDTLSPTGVSRDLP